MKKEYRKATMKVLDVECEQQILSASSGEGAVNATYAPGGDVKTGSGLSVVSGWFDLG